MAQTQHGVLVEGSVTEALRKMAVPMGLGMIFMILVNIIDTFWVARLGTQYVAAMTFTFPVVGLVINLSLGIMIGTSTAVARAIGQGKAEAASRLTTHACILAILSVLFVAALGLLTQDFIFRALGAEGEVLALTKEYMTIWYLGVVFLMVPLIANGALRASGDAKTPMRVMMLAAIVNAFLDPLFIYGWGAVPAMGLQGAAYATLIARIIGMCFVFWVLLKKTKLLKFGSKTFERFVESVKSIFSVGIPAAITNALGPLAVALVTGIVAQFGEEGLAAYGIGAKVDALVLMAPMALGSALSPFIGQNWGAHLLVRVSDGIRRSIRFGLYWGLGGALALMLTAPWVADAFTDDPNVKTQLILYLQVIPIGYAFLSVSSIASSSFNAVDRAKKATWLSIMRSLVLAIPMAYLGGQVDGLRGVFGGLVLAYLSTAFFGIKWLKTLLNPDGEISPEDGVPVTANEVSEQFIRPELRETFVELLQPVLELEGLNLRRLKDGNIGIFVAQRELAHFDQGGRLDFPLPIEVGENLVRLDTVDHHPEHNDNGWYIHRICSIQGAQRTVWLIRMLHLLYQLSRRGAHDPITQAEMDDFTVSEQCVTALTKASNRWLRNDVTPAT